MGWLDPAVWPASVRCAFFAESPFLVTFELDFVPYIVGKQKIYRFQRYRLKNLSIKPMGVPAP